MNVGKRVVEIVFGVKDNATPAMKKLGETISGIAQQFPALSVLGGLAIKDIIGKLADMGRAAVQAYKDMVQLGAGFQDMSNRTDMSVESLTKWKYIAEQNGSSLELFEAAMRKLRQTMASAVQGDTAAVDTFEKLGVAYKNADGSMRDLEKTMLDIGQAVRTYGTASIQGAAAQEALGRGSASVVAILKQGTGELKQQSAEAKLYTGAMTAQWAAMADAADDAAQRSKTATQNMMAAMMPATAAMTDAWTKFRMAVFAGFGSGGGPQGFAAGFSNMYQIFDAAAAQDAKAAGTAAAEAYVGGLIQGLATEAKGPVSDATQAYFEQGLLDAKMKLDLRNMMRGMGKDAVSTSAGGWQGRDGGGAAIELQPWGDLVTAMSAFDMTSDNMPVIFDEEELGNASKQHEKIVEQLHLEWEASKKISDEAANLALGLGDVAYAGMMAFATGTSRGLMFGRMLRDVILSALADMIVKLTVIKGLMSVFKMLGFKSGGTVPMAMGGSIPRAAYGYAVPDGPRGMDSRLIAAMPGEEVVSRGLSQRLSSFLSSFEYGGAVSPFAMSGSGGRGVVVNFQVGRPVGVIDALSYGEVAARAVRKVAEANL